MNKDKIRAAFEERFKHTYCDFDTYMIGGEIHYKNEAVQNRFIGFKAGYEAGQPKWLPISEKSMPNDMNTVLVWNGDIHLAYFTQTKYTKSGWFIANNGDYCDGGYGQDYKMGEDYSNSEPLPTHFMPLPQPPEEK